MTWKEHNKVKHCNMQRGYHVSLNVTGQGGNAWGISQSYGLCAETSTLQKCLQLLHKANSKSSPVKSTLDCYLASIHRPKRKSSIGLYWAYIICLEQLCNLTVRESWFTSRVGAHVNGKKRKRPTFFRSCMNISTQIIMNKLNIQYTKGPADRILPFQCLQIE